MKGRDYHIGQVPDNFSKDSPEYFSIRCLFFIGYIRLLFLRLDRLFDHGGMFEDYGYRIIYFLTLKRLSNTPIGKLNLDYG